eukprot:gene4808-3450_t
MGKEKQLFRGIFAFIANRDLFAQSDFYFSTIRYAPPCRRQKIVQVEKNFWMMETEGKEKQLFRGIFAFIANRDLPAQSDFYFFHDSLRPPCRRQKIVQVEKKFWMMGFMPARARPRSLRRSPVDVDAPTGTPFFDGARENAGIAPAAEGNGKGKEKQLFRGIFAFIANRDLFAQSDFYFSTIRYAPPCRRQKIVQVEKNFWMMGFMPARARPRSLRRSPVDVDACQPAPIILTALGKTRELLQRRKAMGWKKEMHKKRKGKEKQLFRGIFAFIANRDLFAQSDFYFSTIRYARHAGARKLYRLRRSFDDGFMPARARPRSLRRSPVDPWGGKRRCIKNGKGKEKQLFRGIFAFIANRDLFAQSDFYFSTIQELLDDGFHAGARPPQKPATQPRRCRRMPGIIFDGARGKRGNCSSGGRVKKNICVEAIEPTRNSCFAAFSPSLRIGICLPNQISIFSTIRYACHAGARKIVQVEKNFWMMGFMPARARPRSLRRSPVDKQLFRGIFAFIANRDLPAQSDFYFFHDSLRPPCRRQKIVQVEKKF